MKTFVISAAAAATGALASGAAIASGASPFVFLDRGETAVANLGETTCKVAPHAGSRNGFVCRVGGDYRARYGVIVNEREVAITEYTALERYRVIVRKLESPLRP